MSLGECIPDMLAKGDINEAQAAEMGMLFGELERGYKRQMGDQAAAAMAGEETLKQLAGQKMLKKRRALLQVQAQRQAWLDMQKYGQGAGGLRALDVDQPGYLAAAAAAKLTRSEYAPYRNVEYQQRGIRGSAHASINQILSKHKRNLVGQVREKAELDDIVRELFEPGSTGNQYAREMAEAWSDTADNLRRRFNAAGGDIGKLERWGLPQAHDSLAVSEAKYGPWRDFIWDKLDRSKMIDKHTGQPFSDEGLELVLRDVYETISTDGWAGRKPGGFGGGGSVANRGNDARFLVFASADDWMTYQSKFGSHATAFDAMNAHIDSMSRDIALMEILGPNPVATIKWLGDTIEKEANLRGGADHIERAFAGRERMQRQFDELIGVNRRPENRRVALAFSALRSFQVATKLGSATLSTTSDQATQILARRMNGIPVMRGLSTQLKMLNPASAADREFAVMSGLIAEEASGIASGQARMSGEELTGERSRILAEGVLRVSGLNAVTQGGRWAFGMDFLSTITNSRSKSWGNLDGNLRSSFERYGMGESHWDLLRKTELTTERGADWITLPAIQDVRLRDMVSQMIFTEMDFAVPVPGVAIQAAMIGRLSKGTVIGETLRTALQFKSFPITLMAMQFQRTMAKKGWNKATYAAQMMILTTAMGAAAIQLKEIAKGRDPRPMTDARFFAAAAAQGGGAGIYGDFLKSTTSRFGDPFLDTLAGPAFQTADQFIAKPIGMGAAAFNGDKVNPGKWLVKSIKSETPGASLWFARLGFERVILDELAEQVDPKYKTSRRSLEKYAAEQGQDYYWAPGDGLDAARSPDLSNMFAEAE